MQLSMYVGAQNSWNAFILVFDYDLFNSCYMYLVFQTYSINISLMFIQLFVHIFIKSLKGISLVEIREIT